MQTVVSWYIALQIFALVVFPLLFAICNRLPDRAWGLSKGVGLLLVTYLVWLMGNISEPGSPWNFSFKSVSAAVIFLAVFGIFKGFRSLNDIAAFLVKKWKVIALTEGIFVVALGLMVALRATVPHISYHNMDPVYNSFPDHAAEKFTDFAILNSLLTSATFPPHDAWVAGENLNYYYFGHLMWATVIKFTSVRPEIGYNLALAGIMGLVAVLAFSLGYNATGRKRYGLLTLFLIPFASNLDGFFQLLGIIKTSLLDVSATERLWNFAEPWWRNYDFWRSSRAVENTITEFPAFSLLLGDLHAHLHALPVFLCGLIVGLQIAKNVPHYRSIWRYEIRNLDELLLAALIVGALSASNSWDVIGFGAFLALALWSGNITRTVAFGYYRPGELPLARVLSGIESLMVAFMVVVVGVIFLFFPFFSHFVPPVPPDGKSIIKIVDTFNRSHIFEVVAHWAYLAVLPLIFAVIYWRKKKQAERSSGASNLREPIIAMLLVAFAWAFVMRSVWGSWTAVLTPLGAAAALAVIIFTRIAPMPKLLFGILFQFFLFLWFCEIFYIDDIFDGAIQRINTVFKVYYGLWILMALAAAMALQRLLRYSPKSARTKRAVMIVGGLVAIGGVYPILGTVNRITASTRIGHWDAPEGMTANDAPYIFLKPSERAKDLEEALDGMRYLRYLHPDDYAAMIWMRTETPEDAVILEAAGSSYTYSGRFGTMTGRQSYAGWLSHSWGWRGKTFGDPDNPNNQRSRRAGVTETIYTTSDLDLAGKLIQETGADYIVVGQWESQQYPHLNYETIGALGTPVYQKGKTTIYQVN